MGCGGSKPPVTIADDIPCDGAGSASAAPAFPGGKKASSFSSKGRGKSSSTLKDSSFSSAKGAQPGGPAGDEASNDDNDSELFTYDAYGPQMTVEQQFATPPPSRPLRLGPGASENKRASYASSVNDFEIYSAYGTHGVVNDKGERGPGSSSRGMREGSSFSGIKSPPRTRQAKAEAAKAEKAEARRAAKNAARTKRQAVREQRRGANQARKEERALRGVVDL